MLLAALLVMRVRDVADTAMLDEVIGADEQEPLTVVEGSQPVPSTGLIDK
jgi:hypothetical protein